ALSHSRTMLDSLNLQMGMEDFHRAGIKGKGVIIGTSEQVDLSLWDFRNPDGTTRFLRYFGKPKAEIDSLLQANYPENRYYPFPPPEEDTLGIHRRWSAHGNAVLAIAAGNAQAKGLTDLSGKYMGVAPEADLYGGNFQDLAEFSDSIGRPFAFNHSWQAPLG